MGLRNAEQRISRENHAFTMKGYVAACMRWNVQNFELDIKFIQHNSVTFLAAGTPLIESLIYWTMDGSIEPFQQFGDAARVVPVMMGQQDVLEHQPLLFQNAKNRFVIAGIDDRARGAATM